MAENKHIIDIISDCVNSIRQTSTITNIVDNGNNTYTFTVTDLQNIDANDYIKIENTEGFNNENQLINSISDNTFTISKTSGQAITTFGTITANSPYFDFGYWLEESNKLTLKGQSTTYKNQRFPLIFLQLEINETRNNLIQASQVNGLQIYICHHTKQDSFSDWRLENTFKSVLIPLYKLFMQSLASSSYIYEYNVERIEHTYIEKHLLGILDGNQNKVNQWIDAIALSIDFQYKIYGDC